MNRIESQVKLARRLLILGAFGRALCYTMFAALIIATIAIALPAMRVMDIDRSTWTYAWLGGTVVAAILAALVYALVTAPSNERVAEEVDRRFGLRERLSSSMTLKNQEADTDFGIALQADAEKRASQLAITDRFSVKPSKLGWLPLSLVPVLAIVLMLAEPMKESSASSLSKTERAEAEQVKKVAEKLKKKIQQQKRDADAKGLEEAKDLFEKLEADLNKISQKKDMNRKEVMIAMNDLKKELEQRRQQLGSGDQMRKLMKRMKGLDSGPGDKVAKAMEKGEFGKAKDIMKDLAKKMQDGTLSEKERKQLEKQVEQMQKQMEDAVKKHEQAKKELQDKIDKAKQEGRGADAAKMQQQMNQMQQRDGDMKKMEQMAEAMKQAQQAMKNGDPQKAAEAMQEMADQLGEMQQEMDELGDLEEAMDELSQGKDQMKCKNCGGNGCKDCQGMQQFGNGNGNGEGEGNGLGKGQGKGDRPEEESDTNTYETKVRADVKKGPAIIAGFADGPNKKGVSREEIKQLIQGTMLEKSRALETENLPRTEQEHTADYFSKLREGE